MAKKNTATANKVKLLANTVLQIENTADGARVYFEVPKVGKTRAWWNGGLTQTRSEMHVFHVCYNSSANLLT